MARVAHSAISTLVTLSLVFPPTLVAAQVTTNTTRNTPQSLASRADYEACQTQDERAFRTAIEKVTISALEQGLSNIDYNAAVAAEWRNTGLDDILDKRVDLAVAEVRSETSWGTLIKSLAYKKQAQKLATEVAERVYHSQAMKSAIENLATGVGNQVGQQIEFASQDAAEPALKCLKAFLGPRYGETIARVVSSDAHKEFTVAPESRKAGVSTESVLRRSSAGITGAAILLVRRQLANLARNVGQRLVGAVLSRLVSVVAGGIGVVLIAKDLWDLRHGVLPIIATEMKAPATKEKVREELAKGLDEQISGHVREIGSQAADRIITIWHQFRSAHALTLDLASRNAPFKRLLNDADPAKLARLDEVTALVLAAEGEAGIAERLKNGTLHESIATLPAPAMAIARETRSLEQALKWNSIAGKDIEQVSNYGIYRNAKPEQFTKDSLHRVFALNDRVAITRLTTISQEARETLFNLDESSLKGLARSLTATELDTLSRYLTGLDPQPREKILKAVAESPGKMQFLASPRVRASVLASADQTAAVDMMLRADGTFNAATTARNFQLAWNGRISPMLIVDKHPIALTACAILLLMVFLMLRRLFVARPKPIPNKSTTTKSAN